MLGLLVLALDSQLDRIFANPKLRGAVTAAIVTDIEGHVLYEHNSEVHITPASNMKLLSNAFALHQLGPDWQPATRIWREPQGTFVETQGNPMLNHHQLVEARERLHLDRRLPVYLKEDYAPNWEGNWEYDDLPNKYSAPVTAFTVDRGSFEFWASNGKPQFRPESYGTKVVVLPGAKLRYDPFKRMVTVASGDLKKDGRLDTLSLPNPDEAAASILGGRLTRVEETPSRAPDLVIPGPKVIDIVGACLPPSDNQLAEQLLMLGARSEGALGADAYSTARTRLTNFLVRIVGIDPDEIRVDDGSGLSRHNFVTTHAIAQLLAWANQQATARQWRSAMAHAGQGTLVTRLKGLTFDGKTGSLDMVAALSGYAETADHRTRIVSVILNNFGCTATEAREVLDRFVEAVASTGS